MATKTEPTPAWWARGLLFENCSCQSVCPGHVHFSQLCTHDPCVGYWAVRFDEGELAETDLAGVRAVVAYRTPQHMIEGNWTEALIIDEAATDAQRSAAEAVLSGRVAGPWALLARFVSKRLPTRYVPIRIEDDEQTKRITIDGLLDSTIEAICGRDRSKPVTFENMFNQIHATTQVIAKGGTRYDDGEIVVANEETHALWSRFHWVVSGE